MGNKSDRVKALREAFAAQRLFVVESYQLRYYAGVDLARKRDRTAKVELRGHEATEFIVDELDD